MQNRFVNVIGSYDIFSKVVPGVVMFGGLVLLLPNDISFLDVSDNLSIVNLASLILVAFTLGMIFGESVHNFAVNMERIFGWVSLRIGEVFDILRSLPTEYPERLSSLISRISERAQIDDTSRLPEEDERDVPPEDSQEGGLFRDVYPIAILYRSLSWLNARREGIAVALTNHRRLFEKRLLEQLDPYRDPEDRSELAYHRFILAMKAVFGLRVDEFKYALEAYPMVSSKVANETPTRSRGFQARFAFCRSMWVTLGMLATAYSSLFIYQNYSELQDATATIYSIIVDYSLINPFPFALLIGLSASLIVGIAYELYDNQDPRPDFLRMLGVMLAAYIVSVIGLTFIPSITSFVVGATGMVFKVLIFGVLDIGHGLIQLLLVWRGSINVDNLLFFVIFDTVTAEVILVITAATIAFFDASGNYKEYYVEYLISDFNSVFFEPPDISNGDNGGEGEPVSDTGAEDPGRGE